MKWALKFSTKGKGGVGGEDGGKPYQGSKSFRNGGVGGEAPAGDIANGAASVARDGDAFRSGSDEEEGPLGGEESYEEGDGLGPDQERDTPILTPPDAINGGRGAVGGAGGGGGGGPDLEHQQRGGKYEASGGHEEENSSATYEAEAEQDDHNKGGSSAPHFTVEDPEVRQQQQQQQQQYQQQRGGGEEGEMDYDQQQGVFDEDGDSGADSLQASKTARMKSFADDPEAHELEDNAEWDDKGDRRDDGGSPRGDENGGEGSHSDHSEGQPNGTEGYASNPSRGAVDQDGRPLDHGEEEEEDEEEEGLVDEEGNDDDDDERHHGAVGNGTRGGGGGDGHGYTNSGERTSRDQADLERRAMAHAYADGLDGVGSREAPGYMPPVGGGGGVYGSGGDRYQQRNMPPAPPAGGGGGGSAGANGISPVDARAAASLAMRTRLAQGGVAVGTERAGVQRPEPAPVLAPGQAAAAAAAALRRGPTPGSHSLPSMVLVPLEALKAHRRVPRSSDRRALVRYRDLPDRSRSFVVFVSHAWMRPHTTPSFAHPDTSSRGGEKYRLIAEAGDRIRAHLPPDVRVLLWIDYSCVDQDSTRRSKATMRGMREYMRRCDAILTVYPGDAADNGEEFLPNRFVKSCAWAGSYKSLAHYCTRGWCRLEMLLGQTEPLPQDGFMFNFLVPKKKKASGAKASVGDRPHFLYGAHQRPHNGRIDVVPRQSSRWFEEHHPEQGNFTHESDRDAIRAVLAKQTSTMAKRSAAIAARYGTDPRRGGSASRGGGGDKLGGEGGEYGR